MKSPSFTYSFTRKSCRFVPHTSGGRQATKNVDRYLKRYKQIDPKLVAVLWGRIYNPSTQEEIHSCLKQLLSLSPEQREDDSSDWEKKMQQHVCEDFFCWEDCEATGCWYLWYQPWDPWVFKHKIQLMDKIQLLRYCNQWEIDWNI